MVGRSIGELTESVRIPPLGLDGTLGLPPGRASGLVLFAHGSGSSRFSPRNTYVAGALRQAGLATLLFDLLSESEAADRANVFDIDLLGGRLLAATVWAQASETTRSLPVGYFGASTGAAAALFAAARLGETIGAVVSRGGRPDLAGDVTAAGQGANFADRRWRRYRSSRPQPGGAPRLAVRGRDGGGARGDPSLRGAGHTRGGG